MKRFFLMCGVVALFATAYATHANADDLKLASLVNPQQPMTATPMPSNPQIQTAAVCYTENSFGATFYWVHPNPYTAARLAMRACQLATPIGAFCWATGCAP